MAGLYPLSRMQQLDSNGNLLREARLQLFDGGTSTPRIGYRDSSLTSPHPDPILADSSGRLPLIYLDDGFYRHRLSTSTGGLIFDDDGLPVLSSTAGGSGTSVDPHSVFGTRDIKVRFDDQPLAGYVRLNGRSIGSASSGATERANADTQPLYEELWAYTNISVATGKGASAVADFAANKPLVLPNAAGRGLFGMDDLGAGPAGVLTTLTIANPTLPGSIGGAQAIGILKANLPSYTLTGAGVAVSVSGTTDGEGASHTHPVTGTSGGMSTNNPHSHTTGGLPNGTHAAANGGDFTALTSPANGTGLTGNTDIAHTHSINLTSGVESASHDHHFSGTGTTASLAVSSGGSDVSMSKLGPAITFMIYIRL